MSNLIDIQYYKSRFGELIIGAFDHKLVLCDWRFRKMRKNIDRRIQEGLEAEYRETPNMLILEAIDQITEYEKGERFQFDIPLLLVGSDFQKTVWQELLNIPYGMTISYLQLASKVSSKLALRAVASANGANAISILVPCHRVLGSRGELKGYAGGIRAKHRLLKLESMHSPGAHQMELFE